MSTDLAPYLKRLENIFNEIDSEYAKGQEHYGGFTCEGCPDNCCTTVFSHYTLAEYFYLCEGLDQLDDPTIETVVKRAEEYFRQIAKKGYKQESLSIMCPLNVDEKCIVYKSRPLICRIHGLPASLSKPGKPVQSWPGCDIFKAKHADETIDFQIDRTLFFTQIADVEKQVRQEMVFFQQYKKTIAEMILDYAKGQML